MRETSLGSEVSLSTEGNRLRLSVDEATQDDITGDVTHPCCTGNTSALRCCFWGGGGGNRIEKHFFDSTKKQGTLAEHQRAAHAPNKHSLIYLKL